MSDPLSSNPAATCPHHPGAPAPFVCARCQTAVCVDCCYTMGDGSICCKPCFAPAPAEPAAAAPAMAVAGETAAPAKPRLSLRVASHEPRVEAQSLPPAAQPGKGCVQHPTVATVARCKQCGAGSCRTCNFVFGNLNLCPVCASTSTTKLSSSRKGYMITAYVMAGWSTLCMVLLFSGLFASVSEDPIMQILMGLIIMIFMAVPAIIGTAMAMSSMRKGSNTMGVWVALIWNGLIFGGLMLLMIVGVFMD